MHHLCLVGGVKGSYSVQHFFCKQKQHIDSKAQLADLRKEQEKYIGKLGSTVVDSKIQFSINFMFRRGKKKRDGSKKDSSLDEGSLPPAPTFDSETGERIVVENLNIHPESSEASIYLMQKLRIGNSECLTFFDSGANAYIIDRDLAEKEKLQRLLNNQSVLGVIRGRTITKESGSFRLNLGSAKDGTCHERKTIGIKNVTLEFSEYGLDEIGKELLP